MKYTQCEALSARSTEQTNLHNFLTWLEEKNINFIVYEDEGHAFLHQTHNSMIMEYFGIDENQLEAERRHILENCS